MRLRASLAPLALALAASVAVVTLSSRASAQQAPPDVVKLRDGSMFRGTIAELVANDHVDLVTANGQTRRFALKDVTYAGAASAAQQSPAPPQGPQPLVSINAARADLRLEANEPDVQFQIRTGQSEMAGVGYGFRSTYTFAAQSSSYQTICTAPCAAALPVGTHRLGLSHGGGGVVEADDPIVLTGAGTLHGVYTSHTGLRIAGYVIGLASVIGGAVLVFESFDTHTVCDATGFCQQQTKIDGTELGVGVGIMIVGSIVGSVLAFQRDSADITFVPLSPVATSGSKELTALRTPGFQPQGMALQLRF